MESLFALTHGLGRWHAASASAFLEANAGLQYVFGDVSGSLRARLGYTQRQIDGLGTAKVRGAARRNGSARALRNCAHAHARAAATRACGTCAAAAPQMRMPRAPPCAACACQRAARCGARCARAAARCSDARTVPARWGLRVKRRRRAASRRLPRALPRAAHAAGAALPPGGRTRAQRSRAAGSVRVHARFFARALTPLAHACHA
jgi:hypothetical protein